LPFESSYAVKKWRKISAINTIFSIQSTATQNI
jgi:hypothetical protein